MENIFQGKVVLVTGASRGIGKATALQFAKAGAFVILNCNRGVDKAEQVKAEIEKLVKEGQAPETAGALVKPFSVADAAATNTAIEEILKEKGSIYALVNNAGIAKDNLFIRMKEEEWDDTLNTNLRGAAFCSKAVTRPMMKARDGVIINLTSVVGQMGNVGQAAYSSSKAGLIGLTKSLAKELASRNIRVNAVSPGFISTEMTADLPESAKEEMLKSIPLGRMGTAEEVAEAIVWLASPNAAYITGQILAINGGMYS